MKQVKVYGPGCQRCHTTEERVRKAVAEVGADATIEKVADFARMAAAGVLATPAVAIDGVVRSSGRVPSEDEIRTWLAE